ncbi:MAG: hypothetical protein KDA37_14025 [Planctomycetales bacterium]|nr:hypothetical protein [Planctomycetales bacterium]
MAGPHTSTALENESEIRDLVWRALDGVADAKSLRRLETLVMTQQSARRAFCDVACLESHLRQVR